MMNFPEIKLEDLPVVEDKNQLVILTIWRNRGWIIRCYGNKLRWTNKSDFTKMEHFEIPNNNYCKFQYCDSGAWEDFIRFNNYLVLVGSKKAWLIIRSDDIKTIPNRYDLENIHEEPDFCIRFFCDREYLNEALESIKAIDD
jgi:hypothetical protein